MTRKRPLADPPPPAREPEATITLPPTDPVQRAIQLLEWARLRDYRIGPTLIVGDVTMQVEDIRQTVRSQKEQPHDPHPYELAGIGEPAEGTGG